MIFTGPYRDPAVISIPGLIAPPARQAQIVLLGEDLTFTVPDPGANRKVVLVIKQYPGSCNVLLETEVEWIAVGEIVVKFEGQEVRKKLVPGIYYYQAVIVSNTNPEDYVMLPQGTFELVEVAGSSIVPVGLPPS